MTSMKTETLEIGNGTIEVTVANGIIYVKALHLIDDNVADATVKYLDNVVKTTPHTIRVYDAGNISSDCFNLSPQCINKLVHWAIGLKRSIRCGVYLIASEPLIYGTARMLGMQASDETMDIKVLKSIDELPVEIRTKIPSK